MIVSGDGGAIVNVASLWGMVGVGQIPEAAYAGVEGRTRQPHARARRAMGPQRRTCELPRAGMVPSEMTEGLMFGDEHAEKWLRQRTPMGRGGDEHELDGALLFLASAASTLRHRSSTVTVDGGWTSV